MYQRNILRMLDIFVSLMYSSHLSIKPTQFLLGENDESEETRYNQSTITHKIIFRCFDWYHIWVKKSENAQNFCNYYVFSFPRLTLLKFIIYYIYYLLKPLESFCLIWYKLYQKIINPLPYFFYSKSSHIKEEIYLMPVICNMLMLHI